VTGVAQASKGFKQAVLAICHRRGFAHNSPPAPTPHQLRSLHELRQTTHQLKLFKISLSENNHLLFIIFFVCMTEVVCKAFHVI